MSSKKEQMDKKIYPYSRFAKELVNIRGPLEPKAFAEMLGLKMQAYYRYERGERKVPDSVIKLARLVKKTLLQTVSSEDIYNKDRGGQGKKGSPEAVYNKDRISEVGGDDLGDLLKMTTAILMSRTEYSGSLAANIKSFYRSLELEKRTAKLENECDDLRKRVAALEDALKLAIPQADPEEAAA